ncbi:hypothetical protein [Sphingomonas sp.]|jgi:hypothetical protein|uniref:hypothetical protein n=1 Tax=Sphingomonas sp. TaxID=28214 RepID=UPI002EDA8DD3
MMGGRIAIAASLGCLLALVSGCGLLSRERYRFKLTIEVDTPAGIKSGSSVYEITAWNALKLLPEERSRDWAVKGDAAAVDLADGRTLFALLKTTSLMREDLAQVSMAALDPAFRNDIVESAGRIGRSERIRSPASVSQGDYPLLVTFRDVRNPKSVERVDPAALDKSFGAGVTLRRITVEITDVPVTTGIEKRLGWLGRGPDGGLDPTMGVTANPTFAQQLGFLDFRRK